MKLTKKKKLLIILISIILVIIGIIVGIIIYANSNAPGSKTIKKVIKKIITVVDEEDDDNSSQNDFYVPADDTSLDRDRRPLAETEEEEVEEYIPEFTSKTVSWNGPKGYVIVIPHNDNNSRVTAELLQAYFKEKTGVELKIVTDKTKAVAREILIGNTNRYTTKLGNTKYAVTLNKEKLIFEGTHFALVDKAADWFMSLDYKSGKVNLLEGECADFVAAKTGGYKYVWGDEFDGSSLDRKKWTFGEDNTSALLENLDKEPVVNVGKGILRLSSIRYYNKFNPTAQYANFGRMLAESMSFQYGYLEMRARVPFGRGTWPSIWLSSNPDTCYKSRSNLYDYNIEIDIFEVFGSDNELIPNIHKWYFNGEHSDYSVKANRIEGLAGATTYKFQQYTNLSNKYHIYGFKWDSKNLIMMVDGEEYMKFDLNVNFDGKSSMDGYDTPVQIRFNNYIYTSDSIYTTSETEVNNYDLPFNYDIDWIRLYQKDGEGELNVKYFDE